VRVAQHGDDETGLGGGCDPHVALGVEEHVLGFGAAKVRPVVDGDTVVAAPALPISLSADHRVVDGHDATTFLERVAQLLLQPGEL